MIDAMGGIELHISNRERKSVVAMRLEPEAHHEARARIKRYKEYGAARHVGHTRADS
jgi:4'-phosphopantetheinyl transferase EntD